MTVNRTQWWSQVKSYLEQENVLFAAGIFLATVDSFTTRYVQQIKRERDCGKDPQTLNNHQKYKDPDSLSLTVYQLGSMQGIYKNHH